MKQNFPVTQKEIMLDGVRQLVSKTDIKGVITYVNDAFVHVSGFSREELIGKSHNVVRHPDMPERIFTGMWDDLKGGRPWVGVVKNRAKNGDHYWVRAHVVPLFENEKVSGFMSARSPASREEIEQAERLYQDNRAQSRGWFLGGTIRGRLWGMIAAFALMLAAQGGFGIWSAQQSNNAFLHERTVSGPSSVRAAQVMYGIEAIRGEVFRALQHAPTSEFLSLHNHGVEMHLNGARRAVEQVREHLSALRSMSVDEEGRALIESFDKSVQRFLDMSAEKALGLLDEGRYREANVLMLQLGNRMVAESQAGSQQLQDWLNRSSATSFASAERRLDRIMTSTLAGVPLALVLMALIGWWVSGALGRSLSYAAQICADISQGNLSGRIDISGSDEMSRVMRSLMIMQTNLKVIVDEIAASAACIDQSSGVLDSNLSAVATQSGVQADQTAGVAAATEQFSCSIKEIAETVRSATGSAETANQLADESSVHINESALSARKGIDSVGTAENTMRELQTAISSIDVISKSIRDIAEQTNLLALNAAIEAARAGEQGRGFAVVADEVRKLAGRTSQSTADIDAIVERIQQKGGDAVTSMQEVAQSVTEGVAKLECSVANFSRLKEANVELATMMAIIADATVQQSATSEDVALKMERISTLTDENMNLVSTASGEMKGVRDSVGALQDVVGRFVLVKR